MKPINQTNKSQADKFKDAAQAVEADEDETHWQERLRKIAKQKPSPKGDEKQTKKPSR